MPEEACLRWVVQGRVQGVGFRWFIKSRAASLGVRGWARNLPDGGVEVVGRAAPKALTSLDELVRRGPPGAQVTDVTTSEVPHDSVDIGGGFEIRR
jgi:acylphosphatase